MTPADITNFAASSTFIDTSITSRRGTKKKKPVVGFGVQGRNTPRYSPAVGRRSWRSGPAGLEMKTIDHMPLTGNSTRPTFRNDVPVVEKMVSNTCLVPL